MGWRGRVRERERSGKEGKITGWLDRLIDR